ncbi:MAG: serine--tRNA ligase [Euryarchaeota archaeon]|nr:serine--tRNA ligase [Euryarchaeota archaeon]
MLDVQLFRERPDTVRESLRRRGMDPSPVDEVVDLDRRWRQARKQLDELRARRNKVSVEVANAKKQGREAGPLIEEMQRAAKDMEALERHSADFEAQRNALLWRLPNLMHESVPVGKDDSQNVPIKTVGEPTKHAFAAKSHVDLLSSLDIADIDRAAKTAGARFFYLKNEGVLLNMAIQRFAIDSLVKKGWIPIDPPYLLRRDAIAGATSLGDFEDVIFKVEGEDLNLIATSEHAIAAMHADEIFDDRQLPLRYAGVSPCFRKEAGAHGKDTKGIFRVRQFHKVEMFVFCKPEDSWDLHGELLRNAEELVAALGIPYRVVNICTGDLGTVAAKKYDLEAWMPVQNQYRELVSCSNCTDYQARRYATRTRASTQEPTRFVHTLNSTALAVERTMVAILENFQHPDGSVAVPKALQPYLGGLKELRPKK